MLDIAGVRECSIASWAIGGHRYGATWGNRRIAGPFPSGNRSGGTR